MPFIMQLSRIRDIDNMFLAEWIKCNHVFTIIHTNCIFYCTMFTLLMMVSYGFTGFLHKSSLPWVNTANTLFRWDLKPLSLFTGNIQVQSISDVFFNNNSRFSRNILHSSYLPLTSKQKKTTSILPTGVYKRQLFFVLFLKKKTTTNISLFLDST